jgi:hypothetical protein
MCKWISNYGRKKTTKKSRSCVHIRCMFCDHFHFSESGSMKSPHISSVVVLFSYLHCFLEFLHFSIIVIMTSFANNVFVSGHKFNLQTPNKSPFVMECTTQRHCQRRERRQLTYENRFHLDGGGGVGQPILRIVKKLCNFISFISSENQYSIFFNDDDVDDIEWEKNNLPVWMEKARAKKNERKNVIFMQTSFYTHVSIFPLDKITK